MHSDGARMDFAGVFGGRIGRSIYHQYPMSRTRSHKVPKLLHLYIDIQSMKTRQQKPFSSYFHNPHIPSTNAYLSFLPSYG